MAQTELHPKGWGSELWLVNNDLYCGKLLTVRRGKKCSLHFHEKKLEHFFVLKGNILLEYAERADAPVHTRILHEGDVVEIKQRQPHRFTGLDVENTIIEISTTHDEDDTYRLQRGD